MNKELNDLFNVKEPTKENSNRILHLLKGDIHNINKVNFWLYDKDIYKNIISGYLTNDYIEYCYMNNKKELIVECIYWAYKKGQKKILEYIVMKLILLSNEKSIIDIYEDLGITIDIQENILIKACKTGHRDIIEYIFENIYVGNNLDLVNYKTKECIEIVSDMYKNKINWTIIYKFNITKILNIMLITSIERKYIELVDYLIDYFTINNINLYNKKIIKELIIKLNKIELIEKIVKLCKLMKIDR